MYGTRVALTRERGSNAKLQRLLEKEGIECVEIPCIAFSPGQDLGRLVKEMLENDVVVISSPHAASVFVDCWNQSGKPKVRVSAVGKGTSKPLQDAGITPFFEPSDATALTLSAELPDSFGKRVLYPTSAIADNTMQKGLEQRGFQVTRLNTYETVEASWSDFDIKGRSLFLHN